MYICIYLLPVNETLSIIVIDRKILQILSHLIRQNINFSYLIGAPFLPPFPNGYNKHLFNICSG